MTRTAIKMPQLGESVVEGTVIEWLKKVGDPVEEFESLVVIGTDKVDSEIPAPISGILQSIEIGENQTVDAGTILGYVGDSLSDTGSHDGGTKVAHTESLAPQPMLAQASASSGKATNGKHAPEDMPHMSPVVARMVAQNNLDISSIPGSGRNGRVTKKDVLAFMESAGSGGQAEEIAPWDQPVDGDLFKPTVEYKLESAPAKPAPAPKVVPPPPAPGSAPAPALAKEAKGQLVRLSSMRKAIAEHMVMSKHTSPHATTVFEIDMTNVQKHRSEHKAAYREKGISLTFLPYIITALVSALEAYPYLNSQWTDEGIFLHQGIHVGIAVALKEGLIVPVLKQASDYNLAGLAKQISDLAERARNHQLKPDEIQNGTFTITNHGVSGSLFATPVINQPQVAILGVGMLEKRVKVVNDALAIRSCAYFSLSFDHRVIDGAVADNFMAHLKQYLEAWPKE